MFKIAPTCFGSQGIHHQGTLYSVWLKLQKKNTDYVHVNGHDRTITVILAKRCIELPDDRSLVIRNMLEQF